MNRILSSASASLVAGLAVMRTVPSRLAFRLGSRLASDFISFLLRWAHILGGIIWVGMIWFVNFILFAALDESGRRRSEPRCTS